MRTYNTPGVWVEEIPTLPPSVAQVATAIPAFIGYTQTGFKTGGTVARIGSLLEYESLFGKAKSSAFAVTLDADGKFSGVDRTATDKSGNKFLMYYGLSLYFRNGGGPCYIVSVGDYSDGNPKVGDFEAGLELLKKEDEPTLVVLLDAVNLPTTSDYYGLVQKALDLSQELGDRFVIIDVPAGEKTSDGKPNFGNFRSKVGTNPASISYGAAYYPYLQTTLAYQYDETGVSVLVQGADTKPAPSQPTGPLQWISPGKGIKITHSGSDPAKVTIEVASPAGTTTTFDTSTTPGTLLITVPKASTKGNKVGQDWLAWKSVSDNDANGFEVAANDGGTDTVAATTQAEDLSAPPQEPAPQTSAASTLAAIKSTNTTLYNQVKAALANQRVTLPPSPAIAGVYARVDGDRGVWKAPANIGIASVIGPVAKISDNDQDSLNVDPTSGKSINAIRDFTGKGTLVWGARTLAGNDNEWRYVPVRRLFITIEESTRKASSFAVFEPNDATAWLKVKAMIDSYLYGLWEQGALAGSKPEQAYFVNVGLGRTMTAQDILEGRMIVEIGVAAVRPAEFVILRFSHKLQEA